MSNVITLKTFKKVLAALTVTATVLSLSGIAVIAPASAAKPSDYGLKEGNTISASGSTDPDIYIVNEQGFKRLFLNPVIFGFYGHLGGFAAVKAVAPTTRDAFPTSGLFRNCETNDPKVYGVEVTGEDTGVLHWVNTTGAQAVADDANFFSKVFCINNNEFNWYAKGSEYTSVKQVPDYTRGGTNTPVPTGNVSVSLASDNPAPATLVAGQAVADLAHFTFTGSGAVTNIKFKRIGVSADATLANVYLYDGAKRLTDAATVASGEITFNDSTGIVMVSGSKTISVRSDIASGTSGQTVGVQVVSVNGTSANASGNTHTIATATLAGVSLSSSTTPSVNASLDPASDITVWQNTATVGTRSVWLKSLQYRVIGSVSTGDLKNFRLFVDGVQKGSAVAQTDSNGFIVFDLNSAPVKLETGGRVVKIMADVVGGSSRNFTVSLRQASDIAVVDSEYNQNILATAGGNFPVDAGQQTVAQGTLTITKKTDSPSGDVVKDASGVTLARFEFKANGESMKVENLRVSNTSNPQLALRNGALFADGVQIGSTQTIWEDSTPGASNSTAYAQFSLGSSLVVVPGTPRVIEVRADIYDASGTNNVVADGTITANIDAGSSNVQRLTSLNYVSNSSASGNQMTVKTGALSASKFTGYANQTVVSPKAGVKVGHFTLTTASSEDVNVNTINIDSDTSGGTFDASKLTDVNLKVVSDTGSTVYTSPAKSTISTSASNSYSVSFTVPKNKTYQVEVWANVASGITNGHSMNLELDASGITAASSTTASTSAVDGQTITAQTGSLVKANGSMPAATLANGGSTVSSYTFTLTPQFDDFTLDEVYVDLSSTTASSTGAIAQLKLMSDSTQLGTATVNSSTGSASFTGLNYALGQANGTKTLRVDVQLSNVGIGGNDTGGNVTVRLDGMKYRNGAGSVTTENGLAPASFTANAIISHKAIPTFSNQTLPSTVLTSGDQVLFKSTVAGQGGNVAFKKLVFTITRSNGPTLDEAAFKMYENGVDISSQGTFATASADFGIAAANTGTLAFTFTNERTISSGTTYELRGSVTATGSDSQSIVTKIANPSVSSVTAASNSSLLSTASLIWSDLSATSHSATTEDWMNDYLVKTINTSQTLSK